MKRANIKALLIGVCTIFVLSVFIVIHLWIGNKEEIKVCAILTLSGNGAATGQSIQNGLLLATNEINRSGGINGRKIKLIFRDSRTDKNEAVQIFRATKMSVDPDIYITNMSFIALSLGPLAGEYKVPLIGFAVSSPDFVKLNRYCIRYYTSAEFEGHVANDILQSLDIDDLAIIYLDDSYGNSIKNAVAGHFEKGGGHVTAKEFKLDDGDYHQVIRKFMDKPAIYIVGFPNHQTTLLKQLNEMGYKGAVIGNANLSTPVFVQNMLADNVFTSAPIIYRSNYLSRKKILQQFQSISRGEFDHYAAASYDSFQILKNLFENSRFSKGDFIEYINDWFIHSGIFGVVNVEAGTRDIAFPLFGARIKNQRLEYLDN